MDANFFLRDKSENFYSTLALKNNKVKDKNNFRTLSLEIRCIWIDVPVDMRLQYTCMFNIIHLQRYTCIQLSSIGVAKGHSPLVGGFSRRESNSLKSPMQQRVNVMRQQNEHPFHLDRGQFHRYQGRGFCHREPPMKGRDQA